ncbi:MAG: site-specific integrase [Clostridia bacterium]|nr:site-specific integrase [Clostridia bacterium]
MNLDNFISGSGIEGVKNLYTSMPLQDYVRVWLDTFKAGSVKPATLSRLETSLAALKKYPIADKPIGEITAFDIQRYVNELTDAGYGLTTIKKQMRIATAPLRQAAAMHFILADPSVGVYLPSQDKVKKQKRNTRPYTDEEQQALWKVINSSDNPAYKAVGLMLETGLRVGECLALRWKCVDLERKCLRVEATILNQADKKRSSLQESPKTLSSKRTVPLTKKAEEILKEQKKNKETEWVFEKNRERISYEALRYQTTQLCKNAGVEYLGEHVFRHTFATNCYYRHIDVKILSKILGHSDVNITYNIYISLRGDGFDEMYAALNA